MEEREKRRVARSSGGGAWKIPLKWLVVLCLLAGGGWLGWTFYQAERDKKHQQTLRQGCDAEARFDFVRAAKLYVLVETDEGRTALEGARALQPAGKAFKEQMLDGAARVVEDVLKRFPGHEGATGLKKAVTEQLQEYEKALKTGRKREEALDAEAARIAYKNAAETNIEGRGAAELERLGKLVRTIDLVKAKKWSSAMQEIVTQHQDNNAAYLADCCVRGGTRIAIRGEAGRKPRVRIVAAGGGKAADVELPHTTVLDVAWTPDGRRLSYCATGGTVQTGLYEYDVAAGGDPVVVASLPGPGDAVSWPAGGRGPVFCGTYQDPMMQEFAGIILAAADGKSARSVKIDGTARNASAAPNGLQLAYQQFTPDQSEIWVVQAETNERKQISPKGAWAEGPAWSPDGTRIAFAMAQGSNFDIYVCAPDGSDLKRLTTGVEKDTLPAWSPDSATLAYVTTREKKRVVVTLHVASGRETVVTETVGEVDPRPAWSPILPDE